MTCRRDRSAHATRGGRIESQPASPPTASPEAPPLSAEPLLHWPHPPCQVLPSSGARQHAATRVAETDATLCTAMKLGIRRTQRTDRRMVDEDQRNLGDDERARRRVRRGVLWEGLAVFQNAQNSLVKTNTDALLTMEALLAGDYDDDDDDDDESYDSNKAEEDDDDDDDDNEDEATSKENNAVHAASARCSVRWPGGEPSGCAR